MKIGNKSRQNQTCMSLFLNILSKLKPVFIAYLLLGSRAEASHEYSLYPNKEGPLGHIGNDGCVRAAPDCVLTVGQSRDKFQLTQVCDPVFVTQLNAKPLREQIGNGRFVADSVCHGELIKQTEDHGEAMVRVTRFAEEKINVSEYPFFSRKKPQPQNEPIPAYTQSNEIKDCGCRAEGDLRNGVICKPEKFCDAGGKLRRC